MAVVVCRNRTTTHTTIQHEDEDCFDCLQCGGLLLVVPSAGKFDSAGASIFNAMKSFTEQLMPHAAAEAACAHSPPGKDRDVCIFEVLAINDVKKVGAY